MEKNSEELMLVATVFQKMIDDMYKDPFIKEFVNFSKTLSLQLKEYEPKIKKIAENFSKYLNAQERSMIEWGKFGWVIPLDYDQSYFFDNFDFILNIPSSYQNARDLVRQNVLEEKFEKYLIEIEKKFDKENKVKDAIWSYKAGNYRLCVLSLFTELDFLLYSYQEKVQNERRKIFKSIDKFNENIDNKNVSLRFVFFSNLRNALKVIYSDAKDFSIIERTINRNMIMHGMSRYEIGKLECWQLLFAIVNFIDIWVEDIFESKKWKLSNFFFFISKSIPIPTIPHTSAFTTKHQTPPAATA